MKAFVQMALISLIATSGAQPVNATIDFVEDVKSEDYFNAKAASEAVAKAVSTGRKPAATYGESDIRKELKDIRTKILGITDKKGQTQEAVADQYDDLLSQLEANYDNLKDGQAKYFAAQALVFKPFRGIVWRMRPLFENSSNGIFAGNKATHSAAVTMLRELNQITNVYIPTEQASVLFKFAVTPSKKMRLSDQFKSMRDFQTYLLSEVSPVLMMSAKRLKALADKPGQTYVMDSMIFYSRGTFDDGLNRYFACGDAELYLAMAALSRAMQGILVFNAYNHDALINVIGRLARLHGVDGFASSELGVTSRERAKVLNEFVSKGFLTLQGSEKDGYAMGKRLMKSAYDRLVLYSKTLKAGLQILQAAPASNASFINPLFFHPQAQPQLMAGLTKLESLATAKCEIRSPVTGETVMIDIPGFYNDPPVQLLKLLPTNWESATWQEATVKNTFGEDLKYRNYSEGRPVAWGDEWRKIFPSLSKDQDVADAMRVLAYSDGAGALLGPIVHLSR